MRRELIICGLLAGITLAMYWPVRNHDFIYFDDPQYVTENTHVTNGLSWQSVRWALSTPVAANWHPVTTLSHVLDCQLFGVNPGAQHLVSVAFHAANAVLLFLVLTRMTGSLWRSVMVAALFALHPLRVESVAWISERKDVLSGFFFMLTLLAYAKYVESKVSSPKSIVGNTELRTSNVQPRTSNVEPAHSDGSEFEVGCSTFGVRCSKSQASGPWIWYFTALLAFALGLMSKPMLVTLPFVLLLLDYWPLGRVTRLESKVQSLKSKVEEGTKESKVESPKSKVGGSSQGSGVKSSMLDVRRSRFVSLVREKAPFFALSTAFCAITFLVQRNSGAVTPLGAISVDDRVANALVSYWRYLAKMFWPANLAVIYPYRSVLHSDQWADRQVPAIGLLLLLISALCCWQLVRRPWLVVGWFWYLGTLVPVIGLVQVGEQAMADRYTYIPLIGLFIAATWEVSEAANEFDSRRRKEARTQGAAPSIRSEPAREDGQPRAGEDAGAPRLGLPGLAVLSVLVLTVCVVLTRRQLHYWHDTITLFEHAVQVTADNASAEFSLGVGLEKQGQAAKAMVHYRAAVAINPRDNQCHYNMGQLLRKQGHWPQAAEQYLAVLRLSPNDLPSHLNLAQVLTRLGQSKEAAGHFEAALRLDPDSTEALNNLAWLLATSANVDIRDGGRAVELAERACALTRFQQTAMLGTLAAAYAEAGRFGDAVATAQQACSLASGAGDEALLKKNQQLLELYRAGKPYHETAP